MATTKNGTYYPDNYEQVADVPNDMKKMAESIDEQFDKKVDKVEGKGLSTNDFTNEAKNKLDGLSNYDDSEIKQDIANIQDEQATQNENIQANTDKNTSQDELIAKLKDNMFNLTAEGTSINVQDSSDLPAVLEVSGGVRQERTTGKNKFIFLNPNSSYSGITVKENKDGSYDLIGTSLYSGTIEIVKLVDINVKSNTQYILSANQELPNGLSSRVELYNDSSYVRGFIPSINSVNKTQIGTANTDGCNKIRYGLFISANTTLNVKGLILQLEEGNIATEIEPYTGGEPSPSPDYPSEVEVVGNNVNLFDKDNADKKNIYINYSSNKIVSSGNAISIILECLPNRTYTVSRTKILANDFVVGASNTYPENDTTLTSNVNGNGKLNVSITTSDSDNYLIVYCRWGNIEYTIDEILNTIKIEQGSVATSYSPYGMGSVEINKVNKNWFDKKSNILSQRYFGTSGQIETSAATDAFLQEKYIPVFSNIKLTFSNAIYIRVCEYDKNKNFIKITNSNTQNKITVECTNETKFIRVSFNGSIDDFQIELREVATDYIPHESEVYNLDIQQPMLSGDTFVKEDGNWFEVHLWNKLIITDKDVFTTYDAGEDAIGLIRSSKLLNSVNNSGFSNYLANAKTTSAIKNVFAVSDLTLFIKIDKTIISTLEEFKQWLATKNNEGKPLYIWYQVTTPTKLPCTEEQKQVLEQLYNMDIYRPVTNIFTIQDLANLKLNYVADSKIYVDNKINNLTNQVNTINELLSATETSSILLSNLQKDLESEVM